MKPSTDLSVMWRNERRLLEVSQILRIALPKQTCSRCDQPRSKSGKYCRDCANAYQREWRKTHPLSEEARKKSITRSYSKVLLKRGHLPRTPCVDCGTEDDLQMHHPDYDNPRLVEFLCKRCHRARHKH